MKVIGQKICWALKISGPPDVQFTCRENELKVIKCHLQASRSMPLVFKTYNLNSIKGVLLNYAVAEHVEHAGVHSSDATLLLPAQKLFVPGASFAQDC